MIRQGIRRTLWLALRRRDRWEREVEEEIKTHLALRAEQLMAHGRSPDDAYTEAVRRFGSLSESRARLLEAARHREERMQRTEYLSDLHQDASFAVRTLRRRKAWTLVMIVTLALGIGATTAVFSVVSSLLLHLVPYPHADRVVFVEQQPTRGNTTGIAVSILPGASVVRAWRANAHNFEDIEPAITRKRWIRNASGDSSGVTTTAVLPSFPSFAGERPIRGRMFTDRDITTDARVALLGEAFWRERFGASESVLGKMVTLGDTSYLIIGVLPASLRYRSAITPPAELWTPLDLRNDQLAMSIAARLRAGVSRQTAERELDSIFARTSGMSGGTGLRPAAPFHTVVSRPSDRLDFRDSLLLLTWAVALVLLVSCANGAHLLLARASTRQREMAVRAALGAGRARLLRQLLTESALLSLAGAVCGVGIGWFGLRVIIALRPSDLDELRVAHLDWTTLALTIAVAIASAVAFALIGGAQAARSSTNEALKMNGISASSGRRHHRVRGLIVVSEMALSAVLVVVATLLVRSVVNLQRADLGFDPRGLYAIDLPMSGGAFTSDAARAQALAELLSRMRTLPHVTGVTVASVAPGQRWFSIGRLDIDGEPQTQGFVSAFIDVNKVQSNYFDTMHMAFERGGTFTDTTAAANEVIVNASFARKHWPDGNALGHRLRIAQTDSEPWMHIVGVVADANMQGPTVESSTPMFYVPDRIEATDVLRGGAFAIRDQTILIRTDADARALTPAAAMLTQLGVKRPSPPAPVSRVIDASIAAPKFVMLLLTVLTCLALALATIGLYGVMTYTVAQRTREIGIRVALGATEARIARGVIGSATALAVIGGVLGLAAAGWATKLIATELYGVTRLDPASFIVGGAVLLTAALVACVVPTRRALAVDPVTAIRAD